VQGAVDAAGLLVGDGREDDIPAQRRAGPMQLQHHAQLHGHHVLHVDRAPAPDHAVHQLGTEGVARP
jgi:hypothetical protein